MTVPSLTASLLQKVQRWIEDDPDPTTRTELERLLALRDSDALRRRFESQLTFGTAGLRGRLGAGPNRMNRAVVIRTTAALAVWLRRGTLDARTQGVCVGFDGRHQSRRFAEDVAEVLAGAGIRVHFLDGPNPTPLLAFATRDLGAAAGVMITASHNPPQDNGYKVYGPGGVPIVPPADREITQALDGLGRVPTLGRVPRGRAQSQGLWTVVGPELERRYLDGIQRLVARSGSEPRTVPRASVRIAYTALHGVGERLVRQSLSEANFHEVFSVESQSQPDPDFPTVDFPNPEEPGAMDRVFDLAAKVSADLVLANDPDADRLAAAAPDADGAFLALSGNDLGCLLADFILDRENASQGFVVSSVVSSPLLGVIAAAHGVRWRQTLTGFKWIAHEARRLEEEEGLRFLFGYEEAIGYTVGTHVRDKDGVSAAVLTAQLAAEWKSQGKTLIAAREHMWRRYGLAKSGQRSIRFDDAPDPSRAARSMEALREDLPTALAGDRVAQVQDLQTAGSSTLPPSNVLILELEGGHRAMVRPSGTEPKLKFYADVRLEIAKNEPVAAAESRAEAKLNDILRELTARVAN